MGIDLLFPPLQLDHFPDFRKKPLQISPEAAQWPPLASWAAQASGIPWDLESCKAQFSYTLAVWLQVSHLAPLPHSVHLWRGAEIPTCSMSSELSACLWKGHLSASRSASHLAYALHSVAELRKVLHSSSQVWLTRCGGCPGVVPPLPEAAPGAPVGAKKGSLILGPQEGHMWGRLAQDVLCQSQVHSKVLFVILGAVLPLLPACSGP